MNYRNAAIGLFVLCVCVVPADANSAGLLGNYYDGITWSGSPILTRVDATIDWPPWPSPDWPKEDEISVRWEGYLCLNSADTIRFGLQSDDGSSLLINGIERTSADWFGSYRVGEIQWSAPIALSAGCHPLTLEYFEIGGGQGIQLYWEPAGQTPEIIPSSALSTSAGPGVIPEPATMLAVTLALGGLATYVRKRRMA